MCILPIFVSAQEYDIPHVYKIPNYHETNYSYIPLQECPYLNISITLTNLSFPWEGVIVTRISGYVTDCSIMRRWDDAYDDNRAYYIKGTLSADITLLLSDGTTTIENDIPMQVQLGVFDFENPSNHTYLLFMPEFGAYFVYPSEIAEMVNIPSFQPDSAIILVTDSLFYDNSVWVSWLDNFAYLDVQENQVAIDEEFLSIYLSGMTNIYNTFFSVGDFVTLPVISTILLILLAFVVLFAVLKIILKFMKGY